MPRNRRQLDPGPFYPDGPHFRRVEDNALFMERADIRHNDGRPLYTRVIVHPRSSTEYQYYVNTGDRNDPYGATMVAVLREHIFGLPEARAPGMQEINREVLRAYREVETVFQRREQERREQEQREQAAYQLPSQSANQQQLAQLPSYTLASAVGSGSGSPAGWSGDNDSRRQPAYTSSNPGLYALGSSSAASQRNPNNRYPQSGPSSEQGRSPEEQNYRPPSRGGPGR